MSQDVHTDYQKAGFGGGLGIGKRPLLLVVDFVQAYMVPSSPLYAGVERVRDVCATVLETARSCSIPVMHTNVVFSPGGGDGGVFFRKLPLLKALERGSPLGEFADGLLPTDDEMIVTKQYASAFFGTSLSSTLTAAGIDTVLIAGLTTSGCIRATAVDAVQHGFVPIVISDAVGDRNPGPHEANLFDLQAKYADVQDAKTVCETLRNFQ